MKGAIGLVFGPVYDVLTRNDGTEKLVLDLGTGSASWLFEMAREFPSVEFVGIDLVPPKIDPATQPPNCRIELDNINLPLDHYYNTADFVHTRFISPGVENYGYLIEQVASILKPGGLFTIAEPVYHLYRRPSVESLLNPRARPGSPDYSAFAAWLHLVKICIHKNGGDTQVALMGRVWMKEHRSFEEVDSLEVFVPFGSYYAGVTENERHWNRFGPLLRENEFKYMLNARPLLLDHFPANLVEDAERKAVQELRDPSKPIWAKLTVQCYRRR
ncbi:hypothetical protein FRC03_008205 [Tulasnella sp. 419]|nr:hypothetical protein FRC03_008205 [Tulasnella sp. 419]